MTSHCVTSGRWRLPGAPLLFSTRPWEPLAQTVSWSLNLGLNRSHLPPLGRVRITFKTQIWSRSLSTLALCLRGRLTTSPPRLSHPPVWLPSSGTCRRLQGFLGWLSICLPLQQGLPGAGGRVVQSSFLPRGCGEAVLSDPWPLCHPMEHFGSVPQAPLEGLA